MTTDACSLVDASAAARSCALATTLQRDTEAWAAGYRDVAVSAITGPLALIHAFTSPWSRPAELRVSIRIAHWVFWLDDVVETQPRSTVDDLAQRCAAVAAGDTRAATDSLTTSLADIRDELADTPLWPELGPLWQDLVVRAITDMQRERDAAQELHAGGPGPTQEQYLRISDGGYTACRVSHLISVGQRDLLPHLETLLRSLRESMLVFRLANDLRSFDRDNEHGDINILMLGATREEIARSIAEHTDRSYAILRPLISDEIRVAIAMGRHTRFMSTFYDLVDFREEVVSG